MKNTAIFFLTAVLLISGCSGKKSANSSSSAENSTAGDSVQNLNGLSPNGEVTQIQTSFQSTQTETKSGSFNTEVFEMVDGFGNRLITRRFKDHPRLTSVTVLITPKGEQTVEVFGQNGERREVSALTSEIALSGNGDEIADQAGIFQTKRVVEPAPVLDFTQAQNLSSEPPAPEKVETEPIEKAVEKTEPTLTATKTESKSEIVPPTETVKETGVVKKQ